MTRRQVAGRFEPLGAPAHPLPKWIYASANSCSPFSGAIRAKYPTRNGSTPAWLPVYPSCYPERDDDHATSGIFRNVVMNRAQYR